MRDDREMSLEMAQMIVYLGVNTPMADVLMPRNLAHDEYSMSTRRRAR